MHFTPIASLRLAGAVARARITERRCARALLLTILFIAHTTGDAEAADTATAEAFTVNECTLKADESCAFVDTLRQRAQSLIDDGKSASAFDLVASYESLYVGHPEYDYLLGVTALSAGENAAAVHALERTVLVQPSYAGAWLDLAIAHFRLGELDTADALLKHVEESFDPPPAMRAQIISVRRKFSSARFKQVVRGWQSEVGLFAGRTSNANYGLSVSTLQLSLDGIPATLLLDPSFHPRSDSFTELRGSASRAFQLGQGERADVYGVLRHRLYGSEADLNQTEAMASGIWRAPMSWPGIEGVTRYAGASLRHLNFDGRSMNVGTFSAGLRAPKDKCSLIGRFDFEYRMFSGGANLDAAIPWLGAGAECGKDGLQYGAQQRIGWDHGVQRRAGGDMLRLETIAYGRWQARPELQLGATLVYAYSQDSKPYSPILENGAQRWVHRFGQKLEAVWVPGGSTRSPWAIVVELENVDDRSNIGLSSVRVTQFTMGVSYRNF